MHAFSTSLLAAAISAAVAVPLTEAMIEFGRFSADVESVFVLKYEHSPLCLRAMMNADYINKPNSEAGNMQNKF